MAEIELTRSPDDRRVYALAGVGVLRLQGLASRRAIATADGTSWRIARRGFWQRLIEATGSDGAVVGAFTPRRLRRGGTVRWDGRDLALRPASAWRDRYTLADDACELAVIEGKGWGRRPVKVITNEGAAVEPGLLLFAAFVVRGLAEDAGTAAAAGSTAAVN